MGNENLLDSIVAQRSDGTLVLGRGVPNSWIVGQKPIGVASYPIAGGKRIGVQIQPIGNGKAVKVSLSGRVTSRVEVQLPAMINNVRGTTRGTVNRSAGTVTLPAGTTSVVIQLDHRPSTARPRPAAIAAPPAEPSPLAPSITSMSPASAAAGDEVTLTGKNFGDKQDASYIKFSDNGINWGEPGDEGPFQVVSWSDTKVVFKVPVASGWYSVVPGTTATVKMITPFGTTATQSLEIVPSANAPVITSVSPTSAAAGDEVTLTGRNFGASQGSSFLKFTDNGVNWGEPGDEADFQIVSWSDTKIVFTVPVPSKGYSVVPGTTATVSVTTGEGTSAASSLAITE